MVKNTIGGSKTKGQARKHVYAKPSQALRISEDPLEIYVQVQKMLGGELCQVEDSAGRAFLCHIRGKFRGRGKRDNFIKAGTWCLVGCRDWEPIAATATTEKKTKLPNCDLLEVYSDLDKEKLQTRVMGVNWSTFVSADDKKYHIADHEMNQFEFVNEKKAEFLPQLQPQLKSLEKCGEKCGDGEKDVEEDDEVNVDDI